MKVISTGYVMDYQISLGRMLRGPHDERSTLKFTWGADGGFYYPANPGNKPTGAASAKRKSKKGKRK